MLYKKQLLTKYKNVLLVDAGDHIQGGTLGLISNGIAIIDIMNKLGYDVVTLGNHEFDYGVAQLEECYKQLECKYISCNYCFNANKTTAGSIYDPYKIIEIGGKKIAFIGVATPQTLSKTSLITIVDQNGKPVYDFLTERNSKELYETVQKHIDKVRNTDKVDYVIIVAHLGIGGDALEENTSRGLLNNLKGVNALIDGHTHLVYFETTKDLDNNDVVYAQTGTKLSNIGVFTIHASDGSITHEFVDQVKLDTIFEPSSLNFTRNKKEMWVDNDMYNYIQAKLNSFSDVLNQVIGRVAFPLNVYKLGTEYKQSHDQLSRTGENILCNLVTDAIRYFGDADVTIMNAGSVREDILEGDITYQEVINTMPFSNDVLVKVITGQDILDALEFGVRTLPESTSRFPQVSGITYKIDMGIPSSVVVDKDEVFVRVDGERRVFDVMVNGEPLDLEKEYTLATNSFIIEGGDGYSMFAKHKEIYKLSIGVDNEVLLRYINETLNGVVPEKYKQVEGRIIKTKAKSKSNDIVILHTNDVHCGVQDSIGYDGLMLYKKILLQQYNHVIIADAGDHIQGGTLGLITNGEAIIEIMNKVGYDVATLGNHEFDYGVEQLEKCEAMLNCKYISTNYCYHRNKQAIYPAYKIIEKGDKKIAFIGVATPQTLSKTGLITIKDENGNLVYDFLTENHSKELFDRVQAQIDDVRSQGVDYVIILAHLGIGGDALEENTSAGLIRNLKNVDALIDGHTHLVYSQTTPDKNRKNVIIAQTGTKLNNIGQLTIHTDGKITHKNINTVPYDDVLAEDITTVTRGGKTVYVDTEMKIYIEDKIKSFSDFLNRKIGY
ncbi:MAG: 5'-nucleotidase C-terminal domain-containing protein, partial [Acholeplasmatales bacterium]|nr:5'-nucleotidase C-terminal domain-containing protein [Acholeplasmatales bacterium]